MLVRSSRAGLSVRKLRLVGLAAFWLIAATVSLSLSTGTSAGAVMSGATSPIGKQLAELKGSDTGVGAFFGNSA